MGKKASVEVGAQKPSFIPIEDRFDLLRRGCGMLSKDIELNLKTSGTMFQDLDDQRVLRSEIAVHRHLGHAGLCNDLVNTGRMIARAGKQPIGRVNDLLTFVGRIGRARHLSPHYDGDRSVS